MAMVPTMAMNPTARLVTFFMEIEPLHLSCLQLSLKVKVKENHKFWVVPRKNATCTVIGGGGTCHSPWPCPFSQKALHSGKELCFVNRGGRSLLAISSFTLSSHHLLGKGNTAGLGYAAVHSSLGDPLDWFSLGLIPTRLNIKRIYTDGGVLNFFCIAFCLVKLMVHTFCAKGEKIEWFGKILHFGH
ncbi:hypothetical protein AB205_0191500 [Aquarana catesbeiana]|uniref:Uncharacterized protein n=1 Tax=Aquarana catesbeiana TaxID=8400 RepID=A0A2G9SI72_AQUCT|nr:hypothetical protein AB205_0191500 [Aquarana catesbeiana]